MGKKSPRERFKLSSEQDRISWYARQLDVYVRDRENYEWCLNELSQAITAYFEAKKPDKAA